MKDQRQENHLQLAHDLSILEHMATEMNAYLHSDVTRWPMKHIDTPPLTIGGYLMRESRLTTLQEQLQPEEQERLQKAAQAFADLLADNVVRFEQRAHQELHTFLGEWVGHLRSSHIREPAYYTEKVDTRVVIQALADRLLAGPYQLDPQVREEMETLDSNLRGRWQPGEFIWSAVWQPAYPAEKYWWLYGQPR